MASSVHVSKTAKGTTMILPASLQTGSAKIQFDNFLGFMRSWSRFPFFYCINGGFCQLRHGTIAAAISMQLFVPFFALTCRSYADCFAGASAISAMPTIMRAGTSPIRCPRSLAFWNACTAIIAA
jgi:hypothetical protein